MATAIRHTATPTPIDALTTVPIRTDACTTAMRIHIDARTMDIRTGGMSCTGVTDTESGRPRPPTKNKAPDISGALNLWRRRRLLAQSGHPVLRRRDANSLIAFNGQTFCSALDYVSLPSNAATPYRDRHSCD